MNFCVVPPNATMASTVAEKAVPRNTTGTRHRAAYTAALAPPYQQRCDRIRRSVLPGHTPWV